MALTRRERRQMAADMEIGRRYYLWYGFGGVAAVMAAVLAAAVVLLAVWVANPDGLAVFFKWAGWTVLAAASSWLFWYVGLRRR